METLTIRHFPEEMEQLPVDPENLTRVLISGLFEEKAKTAEGERPFYTFIPENLEYDQQCLVIAPPAQADIPEFLESSGLRQFAEEKQLFLFFLKAEDGKWDLSGKDAAYMNAVYVAAQARDHYITMQDNFYALGFGNGADVAHQAVMTSSSEWSGLLTVGDLSVDLSRKVLEAEKAGWAKTESCRSRQSDPRCRSGWALRGLKAAMPVRRHTGESRITARRPRCPETAPTISGCRPMCTSYAMSTRRPLPRSV